MTDAKLKVLVPLLLAVAIAAGRAGDPPAEKAPESSKLDLTAENAAKVSGAIRPQGNEWRHLKVSWYTDIVAARKKAALEDKPLLVFRTGGAGYNDPLGQC
jgi:hypothetical protein